MKIDLLGELNRLRDPASDDRDDPSNLLDNTSGGKQIQKWFKAAGSWGIDGFFVLDPVWNNWDTDKLGFSGY
jgi:hypothetical protein